MLIGRIFLMMILSSIADIGNNKGDRTDLKIYKVSISDYNLTENDTVIAERKAFNRF